MTIAIATAALTDFRARLCGEVLVPGDSAYDPARSLWNGMIDRRPAAIVRCAGVADVMSAVAFARDNNVPVSVRGGGHNVAGTALRDDALAIDLSTMKGVRVDPNARTVRAQGGVTWGELDRETLAFGLATPGGAISTTGIAGLTLGGGVGWLTAKHGLACDNLLSADIVTADGKFLTASASANADLFWAIRGGGGNFGVVTSFEYRVHELEPITGGLVLYSSEMIEAVLHLYRDFTGSAPDAVMTMAGILNGPPDTPLMGTKVGFIAVCHSGPEGEGERLVRPLKEFGPPVMDMIGPMSYTALQTMLDAAYPSGHRTYWRSNFTGALDDEAIRTIVARSDGLSRFGGSAILIEHIHGAAKRVDSEATAFANRDANYNVTGISVWQDGAEDEKNIAWARAFGDALKPFATGAGYINYMTEDEGSARVRAAYGANYERLADVKRRYDPDNFFSGNQNIAPRA